jgi:hypothetical protein
VQAHRFSLPVIEWSSADGSSPRPGFGSTPCPETSSQFGSQRSSLTALRGGCTKSQGHQRCRLLNFRLSYPRSSPFAEGSGRRLRLLRTARTLVKSGEGDLESGLGSRPCGFESRIVPHLAGSSA